MANSRLKTFFVYLHNNTNDIDDEIIKVLAKSKESAKKLVPTRGRFTIGSVMTRKGLMRYSPEWHSLLWGTEPEYMEE